MSSFVVLLFTAAAIQGPIITVKLTEKIFLAL